MKLLNQIPTKNFVAIDVETVRIKETFEELSEEYQSAWEYKNKQDGEIPDNNILADIWEKNSSLYAEFSKVCAVSIAFLDTTESKLMVKEFFGENEETILQELGVFLDRIDAKGNYRLLAHAGKYFDYPYLCKRYVINGLDIPNILDTVHLKPWESKNLCTNQDIWKMGGTGPGSSLQALCTVLNIPISKVDLVGDEVGKAYFEKELARIGRYCSYDTIATFNIVRKIKKEPIFQFDEVIYIGEEKVIEEPTVLEKLYATNQLTDNLKKDIEKLTRKKKLTATDKKNLVKILLSVYQAKGDKVTVKKEKQTEVEEFIKTL